MSLEQVFAPKLSEMLNYLLKLVRSKIFNFILEALTFKEGNFVRNFFASDLCVPEGSDSIKLNEFALVCSAWVLTEHFGQ